MTKEEIMEFIKKQRTSIISSVDEEGYPWTRALIQPRYIDGNDIYFATYTSSNKVRQYRNNSKSSIYFYKKGVTDPEYCILKFTCSEAQWFSNFKVETIKF